MWANDDVAHARGEAPSAPSSDALAARAAHAANAPGHVRAPRRPTGTDDGQEREVGTSCTTRPSSGRILLPRWQAPSTLPWTWMRCLPPRVAA